jgi:hypothetical protein
MALCDAVKKSEEKFGIIEAWHEVLDQELEWWPFAFLKPEREQALGQPTLAFLAVLHALPVSLLLAVAAGLDGTHINLWSFCSLSCAGAHLFFWLMVGVPWNRRARALTAVRPRTPGGD